MKENAEEKIKKYLNVNFQTRCAFCNEERYELENGDIPILIEGIPVKINNVCSRCANRHFKGKLQKTIKNGLLSKTFIFVLKIATLIMMAYGGLRKIEPKSILFWILRYLTVFVIAITILLFSVKFGANIFIQKKIQKNYALFQNDPHFLCPNCHKTLSTVITKYDGETIDFDKEWDYDVPGYHHHCPNCSKELKVLRDPKLYIDPTEAMMFIIVMISMFVGMITNTL